MCYINIFFSNLSRAVAIKDLSQSIASLCCAPTTDANSYNTSTQPVRQSIVAGLVNGLIQLENNTTRESDVPDSSARGLRKVDNFLQYSIMWQKSVIISTLFLLLPLDEALASRAVFVIVSGSDGRAGGRTDGNAFGAS